MNGRERFFTALKRNQPDCVPVFELLFYPGLIQTLVPGASYADFCEIVGLDGVITSTPSSLYSQEIIEQQEEKTILRTEWGETRIRATGDLVAIPIRHPVLTHQDWDRYKLPAAYPQRLSQLDDLVQRFKGHKAIGVHLHDAFSYPAYIFGMDALFIKMYEDPDWVQEVIRACVDHTLQMLRIAAEKGAEFVVFGDDYGGKTGPLMSPRQFQTFFLPGIARVIAEAHALGLAVIKHTDGQVSSLLPMLVDAGIDAFHPSDPSAGMDIDETKKRFGERICVMGGIDVDAPLSLWAAAELVAEVRRRISQLAPGGGWIMASSCSIHASVRPENYLAMVWAARSFGRSECLGEPVRVPELEQPFPFLAEL